MAAAFGHAARRLCGSALRQRTQEVAVVSWLSPAAEQLAQRRLSPPFTDAAVHHPHACGEPDKDGALKQIQRKKEELYDLMAEAHRTYGATDQDRAPSVMNKQLLQYLSGHVQPRPYDPTWRSNRESKAIGEHMEKMGLLIFCGGLWVGLMNMMLNTLAWLHSL